MDQARRQHGDVIADKYVIGQVLGEGGMGTVYATTHRLTGKRLALKCLLPTYTETPLAVERFLREARAVGRVHHRHVIDIYDVGRDGDLLFMVMPVLEGQSFSQLLQSGALGVREALVILTRALTGVAAAHELGIIHRDLKPSNLFVCFGMSGQLDDPRVLDFGISKLADELEPSLTRTGTAVGTPCYMAIEQLTGRRDLDQRVDVYAAGVILYETLAGRLPHHSDNVADLALRIMHLPPEHLSVLRPDLPFDLCAAIMRALAREREDRFQTMPALIEALTPYTLGTTTEADLPIGRPSAPTTPRSVTAAVEPCAPTRAEGAHGSARTASAQVTILPAHQTQRHWVVAATLACLLFAAILKWTSDLHHPSDSAPQPDLRSASAAPSPASRPTILPIPERPQAAPPQADVQAQEVTTAPPMPTEARPVTPRRSQRRTSSSPAPQRTAATSLSAPTLPPPVPSPVAAPVLPDSRTPELPRAGALLENDL